LGVRHRLAGSDDTLMARDFGRLYRCRNARTAATGYDCLRDIVLARAF
jgi:hypothetical protein